MIHDADPGAALPFEPGQPPKTYRFPPGVRWTLAAFALALAALAAWLASPANSVRLHDAAASGMLTGVLLALAAWLLVLGQRTRLVLSADELDYRGAFLSRRIAVAHILGRRRTHNSKRGMRIVPRPGRGREFLVSGDLARDASFDAWFARIPDLDAAEHSASLAQLQADRSLGATPRDVDERLFRAKLLANIGAAASIALLVELQWGALVWDFPLDVTIAVGMSTVALLAAGLARGLVTLTPLDISRNDARPSLFPMILLPSIGVLVRLPAQSNFDDWRGLALPALVGGALGAAYAMAFDVDLRRRLGGALVTLVGMATFAAAAWLWLDVHADSALVAPARVLVTGRWVARSPAATIGLGPAATTADWTRVRVSRQDLRALQVGDVACLAEHAGLLGLRWAELHRCAGDPASTPEQSARHWLAHVARPASQRPPLARQLVAGDWQSVDATLNGLQKRFENGEATAVDVEQAFIPLYNVEPALDAPLADWLAHAPDSWAAHVAMALHTERQIEWLQGAGFDERNSPAFNWQERTRFGLMHAQASMRLSSRPALSLMTTYRLTVDRWKDHADWVARMVAIDPDDVSMRRESLIRHPVCPCRGQAPTDPAMAELLRGDPSQRVRDTLRAYRLFERGQDAGNTPAAVALYTQALALQPYPQDAYSSHINIAVALIESNRLDEATTQLQAAIATLPGNRHAHEELGYVYELQNRKPEALAEFLVDAERGQAWAQMRVGSYLLVPETGVTLDRKTGVSWMRRAADNGDADARSSLRRNRHLLAEFPPTD